MNNNFSSSHKKRKPESGVLYIVGTPIGNLSDISIRALDILKSVSLIFCEDTRQTKKLMNKYEFKLLHKKHNDDIFSEQSKFIKTFNYIFLKKKQVSNLNYTRECDYNGLELDLKLRVKLRAVPNLIFELE